MVHKLPADTIFLQVKVRQLILTLLFQGSLGPYERRLMEFTFGPSFQPSEEGWDHHQGLPTQRDYALFVKFVSVGTQATVSYTGGHGMPTPCT